MQTLRHGARGAEVQTLQRALNRRASPRELPTIRVDGVLGPDTAASIQRVARALGARESTLAHARDTATTSVGLQRMIRWPSSRTPAQLLRARDRRRAAERRQRELHRGPAAALKWARQWIGRTEQPAGSNSAPWGLTAWQRDLGEWLLGQAWCGVFVGTALRRAGVQGVTSRVASVWLILEDALARRGGFEGVVYRRRTSHGSVRAGLPGDVIGLFGEGTHVALIERRVPDGYQTIEGNTSPGTAGDQANGGGVWRRIRPDSAIAYIVRPDYPEV